MSCATEYVCDRCAHRYSLREPHLLCSRCGGLLEVEYDLSQVPSDLRGRADRGRSERMWRWRELLPLPAHAVPVTLGEGDTPLLPVRSGGPDHPRVWCKNDALMPTGSFKDRGMSLAVSMAVALGIHRGTTYSSGNAGASLAAYGARAGLELAVLVEYTANPVKQAAIAAYGAHVLRMRFTSTADIFGALETIRDEIPYTFVNFINPVRHEAMKTYAYEICEARDWRAPDVMIHPVGTGGGLVGAWKGFVELRELGWIDALPRMVAVQPVACAPIVAAIEAGDPVAKPAGDPAATIAQSVAGDAPIQGGERVLRAIRASGGGAVAVTDDELLTAIGSLGREGVLAEPSGAAAVAALAPARRQSLIEPSDDVVCVITGSGLKQPDALRRAFGDPAPEVEATPTDLAAALNGIWSEPPSGKLTAPVR